jgi:hypothetical protein
MSIVNKDWMRQNTVDVTKYLPEFLQSDPNFKAVADACSLEHENIRVGLQDIFNQFFINTATWGLSMYESVLDLTPAADEIIEYRRKQILVRLSGLGMSTVAFLTKIINTYGSGYIQEYNDHYYFNVYTVTQDAVAVQKMKEDINTYKPAHLGFTIYLGYSWNGNITFDGSSTYGTYIIGGNE